ncbi:MULTISPECIES: GNAT family N-acetyltransferase [unclassified Streptomyces]|uniref:GNAT family N-acetyltransferase n=1 Tax=unclassified Streptomyces TaxID=2593676 RepID=UPI0004CB9174|nr:MULTISPECIES: GNAT family N-acetyltransferase [unclassified Streptomyces]MBG7697351.1 GNAT family N-acetyltransferase [Streptomyces sp. MC1]
MAHPTDVRPGAAPPLPDATVLDNAVWSALAGPHAHLADRHGSAARYRPETYAFAALADPADPAAWTDLHTLVGPGNPVRVKPVERVPDGWEVLGEGTGVQLVDTGLRAEPDPDAVHLGPDDVPEILDLVARTRPGPFLRRTVEMGTYLGIRHRGRLVAMAGERLRPPGWTEISAVCTDPAYRGRGLATRLVRAVAAGIRDRGDTPFLHAAADNAPAIRLYESIGFTPRRRSRIVHLLSPGTTGAGRTLNVTTRSARRTPTRPAAPDGRR